VYCTADNMFASDVEVFVGDIIDVTWEIVLSFMFQSLNMLWLNNLCWTSP